MSITVGAQIANLRRQSGMTQDALGQAVGVSGQAVSKWEKGGTPDVELLPSLADVLEVSIDELFGREPKMEMSPDEAWIHWLQSIPVKDRIQALSSKAIGSLLQLSSEDASSQGLTISHLKSCYADIGNEKCLWMRSFVGSDSGLCLGISADDLSMLALFPEPPNGYAVHFASNEDYRALFGALAQPGALELLQFLYGRDAQYYLPSVLAPHCGLTLSQTESLLPQLTACNLLQKIELQTEQGRMHAYCVNDTGAFVPLLYIARWLSSGSGWNTSWSERTEPLLRTEDTK